MSQYYIDPSRVAAFYNFLAKAAEELDFFVVADRIILIDAKTGEATTMQIMGGRKQK